MTDKMLATVENGVGWLTINNPERRNAVSLEMALRGADIVEQFTADASVRVIVIRAAGEKAWMSGADIGEFENRPANNDARQRTGLDFYHGVRNCPKPVVAMIHGYCLGGGVALACACDLRVVADNGTFGIPAGRLGIAYRPDFTRWILEAVGAPNTKEILYTARRYSAEEALRIGLATRVVPLAELESFTRGYVAAMVENAPLSVRASKGIVNQVVKSRAEWDRQVCDDLVGACANSADFVEGRRAFLEKRPPAFRGE